MRDLVCLTTLILTLSGCAVSVQTDLSTEGATPVKHLQMPANEGRTLPFSAAVQVGDTLYLAGTLGSAPGSRTLAPGGIRGETRQAMENIKATVEQFGSSMDRVAKCTVFLADMSEWAAMNEVYTTYFKYPPARTAVAASGLALDARVEIECIAVTG